MPKAKESTLAKIQRTRVDRELSSGELQARLLRLETIAGASTDLDLAYNKAEVLRLEDEAERYDQLAADAQDAKDGRLAAFEKAQADKLRSEAKALAEEIAAAAPATK